MLIKIIFMIIFKNSNKNGFIRMFLQDIKKIIVKIVLSYKTYFLGIENKIWLKKYFLK